MLTIAILVILVLVGVLAELMISNGVRTGKYDNPNVATHVVRGTIYDRNGRALALEVPTTTVFVRKIILCLNGFSTLKRLQEHKQKFAKLATLQCTHIHP